MVLYHSSNLFINFLIHPQPIHLCFLHGWPAIFVCVICQHLLLIVGSAVIILRLVVHLPLWSGMDIPYYHIQESRHPHQLKSLSIVHMCFNIFLNLHLVVFAPLLILILPPPTSAFQQFIHTLPCFIQYFCIACYQVIFFIHPMQIYHQLLLLRHLLLHNGVFAISPLSNIVGCLMYIWHLIKGSINIFLMFFSRFIHFYYYYGQVNPLWSAIIWNVSG